MKTRQILQQVALLDNQELKDKKGQPIVPPSDESLLDSFLYNIATDQMYGIDTHEGIDAGLAKTATSVYNHKLFGIRSYASYCGQGQTQLATPEQWAKVAKSLITSGLATVDEDDGWKLTDAGRTLAKERVGNREDPFA